MTSSLSLGVYVCFNIGFSYTSVNSPYLQGQHSYKMGCACQKKGMVLAWMSGGQILF